MKIVWWVKRDIRLADNAALSAAVALAAEHGGQVLPVFAHEPALLADPATAPMHAHAWCQALGCLRADLRRRGTDVFVAEDDAVPTLEYVRMFFPFTHVFAHEETGTKVTFDRDTAVRRWCRGRGVQLREFAQSSVQRGAVDRDRLRDQWQRRVAGVKPLPAPDRVPTPAKLRDRAARTAIPAVPGSPDWQPVTECDARATLASFLADRVAGYSGGISSPASAAVHGSRLSTHLAWGTLSVRQAFHAAAERLREVDAADPADLDAGQWSRGLRGFLARLHWRDHFVQRLESEPAMEFRPLHPAFDALKYEDDPRLLAAWAAGMTGFPLVDATMRCLAATGFVNFRMRAMALSFATHALHLDWRTAHVPLARVFRDYEPGVHLSQLQMQAGVTGLNTIRVYSPHKQLAEQDPACAFVKRWVPELRRATPHAVRDHHLDPVRGYVPPVVDFAVRTRQMKDLLFKVRATQDPGETLAVYSKHGTRPAGLPRRPTPRRPVRRFRADQPGLS